MTTGFLALYLLLDWLSYVEFPPQTSITPWNPNTGALMTLLMACGGSWSPLAALANFAGELLTDFGPPPWWVLALTSSDLAACYGCAAWILVQTDRLDVGAHRFTRALLRQAIDRA